MEAWQGLESLTQPTLDSVLGVIFPHDNAAFECFVYLGERRMKMVVCYNAPALEEGILFARCVVQHFLGLLADVLTAKARQNQRLWLQQGVGDEGNCLSHDIARQRIAFDGLIVSPEFIHFAFDDGAFWIEHHLYSEMIDKSLEISG